MSVSPRQIPLPGPNTTFQPACVRSSSRVTRRRVHPGLLVAAAAWLLTTGCVERILRIDSTPPGADVFVNGKQVGRTPLEMPFEYYGHYRVDLWMDDRQPLTTTVDVDSPWYQMPGIDLFAELVDPRTHRDLHEHRFELEPYGPIEGSGGAGAMAPLDERSAELSARLLERANLQRRPTQ